MNPQHVFETHRERLFALAYRLLGSRSNAEDMLQDAWLRWQGAAHADIRDPEAWLVATATRLGLDRLRAARSRREAYPGPWLPEPASIEADGAPGPAERLQLEQAVSIAFLWLLERLTPDERAVFVLREAFDYDHARIAALLGLREDHCRQLAHRARARLRDGRPRFEVDADAHRRLLARFMQAARDGDRDRIAALLHDDARLVSDGGGQVAAAIRPLVGAERIARLYWAVARRADDRVWTLGRVNGEPAILQLREGRVVTAMLATVVDGRIAQLLNVMNPDKLRAAAR